MIHWISEDVEAEWGICLGRSHLGNAAFMTYGLAAFGLPDLVVYTEADALEHPDEYDTVRHIITSVIGTLRAGEASISRGDTLTLVGINTSHAPPLCLRVSFIVEDYVLHDVLAVVAGRTPSIGLVQLKIEEVGT